MKARLSIEEIHCIEVCVREIEATSGPRSVPLPVSERINKNLKMIRTVLAKVLAGPDEYGRLFTRQWARRNLRKPKKGATLCRKASVT